jgi:hypothetical protein
MPRQTRDYKTIHAAADKLEPKLAGAFRRAVPRMRAKVRINELAAAIAAKDVKRAMKVLQGVEVAASLEPCGTVSRDAFMRGGRVGAELVNAALEGRR